jgi:hypothetical protein
MGDAVILASDISLHRERGRCQFFYRQDTEFAEKASSSHEINNTRASFELKTCMGLLRDLGVSAVDSGFTG